MGEILCLSKSQQNLPACTSALLSEMNFMLFCELFLWELGSFRHPVLCIIHNVFSRHRAYSIASTWELRGLCVWVFMLDVFWSWTLRQIHKCIGFHSALLHLHFLWLTWKKFLLEGKNGAHCIVTGVNKTDFDRHIVWMLAGLFFSLSLSLSPQKRLTLLLHPHLLISPIPILFFYRFCQYCSCSCSNRDHIVKCANVVGGCSEFSCQFLLGKKRKEKGTLYLGNQPSPL